MEEGDAKLKLENQICFSLYAVSRIVTQQYQPFLQALGITYPQYLVFLVLWETNGIPVKELSDKLLLESNTLTPLLKRLENKGLISRKRSKEDERKVVITLTEAGIALKLKAKTIPDALATNLNCLEIEEKEIRTLKKILDKFLYTVKNKN
ncbi:MAG: MarR family transcriptional regulator [Flavobacteriaceae bacterium]|nr:MarR family transcriptional regulator [Flavobacteriaceae bacterium]